MRKLLTVFIVLAGSYCMGQTTCDILIRNGRIVDGTGNSWFYGDVAVTAGKIVAVGKLTTRHFCEYRRSGGVGKNSLSLQWLIS